MPTTTHAATSEAATATKGAAPHASRVYGADRRVDGFAGTPTPNPRQRSLTSWPILTSVSSGALEGTAAADGVAPGRPHVRAALAAVAPRRCRSGSFATSTTSGSTAGFAPPRDPVVRHGEGTVQRFYVASAALGGRRQPVDVYLPPGYAQHPSARYPVFYLLHGVPGRPGAFLQTVRMGVVEDILLARHTIRPMILVMPFGSTGSFTDKEWANGVRPHEGVGDVPRRATSCGRRRGATARSATGERPRTRRALGGRLRGSQHRAPPSRAVPGARELVGLRARRRHAARSSAADRRCCAGTAQPRPSAGRGRAAPCAPRPSSGSTRASGGQVARRRTRRSRAQLAEPRHRAPLRGPPRRSRLGALARPGRGRSPRRLEAPRGRLVRSSARVVAPLGARYVGVGRQPRRGRVAVPDRRARRDSGAARRRRAPARRALPPRGGAARRLPRRLGLRRSRSRSRRPSRPDRPADRGAPARPPASGSYSMSARRSRSRPSGRSPPSSRSTTPPASRRSTWPLRWRGLAARSWGAAARAGDAE